MLSRHVLKDDRGNVRAQSCFPLMLQELHYRYYEPLCQEVASLGDLIMGPPVKKLLFMTDPSRIAAEIEPYWKVGQIICIATFALGQMRDAFILYNASDPLWWGD